MIKTNYLFLFAFLFALLNLPESLVNRLRDMSISCVAFRFHEEPIEKDATKDQLALENQALKKQIEAVQEWLQFDQRIEQQIERYFSFQNKEQDLYWREFFQRRSEELSHLITLQMQSIPATVIFRESNAWSSTLWINVGEKDNEKVGRKIIAKHSAVVVKDSLVGLVEYVGKDKSRVRLITDSGLVPSVRATRGKEVDLEFIRILNLFLDRLQTRTDLFEDAKSYLQCIDIVKQVRKKLSHSEKDLYLAKGEVSGGSQPLWRSYQNTLKGVGFNYDYPDKEGPARDLRTSKVIKEETATFNAPLIQTGDLLITTGMDGIFPAGLHVGIVSHIDPLEDGDYAYSLEAITTEDLNELKHLFVLPPISEESFDSE